MPSRRQFYLLGSFAAVALVGLALAATFDNNEGWNHPGQFVANVGWIGVLLAVLGFCVTSVALMASRVLHHGHTT